MDGIIAEKEKSGEYQSNPDWKSQRMYNCWDSSAVENKEGTEGSTEISRGGTVGSEMAASMVCTTKLFLFFVCNICIQISSWVSLKGVTYPRRDPNLLPPPLSVHPAQEALEPPAEEPTNRKGRGKGKGKKGKDPAPPGVPDPKPKTAPKAKTPEQEAKHVPCFMLFFANLFFPFLDLSYTKAMSQASNMILELKGGSALKILGQTQLR